MKAVASFFSGKPLVKLLLWAIIVAGLCPIIVGCAETKVVTVPTEVVVEKQLVKTIFEDDFTTNQGAKRNLWKSNGKAHWAWEDGYLRQTSEDKRALNAIMYVTTPQISNATIDTRARINYDKSVAPSQEELKNLRSFIGTGIIFRMVDENNYYMFRLAGEEGCVLGKMVDGKWVDLKNPRRENFLRGQRIKPNQWYNLRVRVYGSNIQCFINDSPVINHNDSTYTLGRFGLITFKCFGDFDEIKVYE
ncbi:MAG: hypothetical protein B6245_14685 [Desulfobacteraceae bacterium 4572_88]|nr:MAG: hypothetical protein B6245_14685 [Desulfobacteraceae bacterium 4572_88]